MIRYWSWWCCCLLSVQHDCIHLVGLFRHRHESVFGLPHSEHRRCRVQVMTRPLPHHLLLLSSVPSQPQTPPTVSSEGMMGKKTHKNVLPGQCELDERSGWWEGKCHHLTLAPPLHLWTDFLFKERPKNQPSVQPPQSTSSFPYVLISSLLPPVRLLVSVMWQVVFGSEVTGLVNFLLWSTGSRFLQQHSSVCKFIFFFFVNSHFLKEKQKS